MTSPHPSRLALAVFDRFVPGNEPLRGDLLEEFASRRSQWWLWKQVLGSVVSRRPLVYETPATTLVGAAILVLAAFQIVLVTNVAYRLLVGPAMPDISGYFYLWLKGSSMPATVPPSGAVLWIPLLISSIGSLPAGWLIGVLHQRGKRLAVVLFALAVALCAIVNLPSPFPAQLAAMLFCVLGLLAGGRFAAPSAFTPEDPSRLVT
jgi:hypothetical protein